MRSAPVFVLLVLMVGCASAPTATREPSDANATANSPTTNATTNTTLTPPVGERGPVATERFVLTADHALAFVDPNATASQSMTKVQELATGRFFVTGDASAVKAWAGPEARHTFEIAQDVDIVLAFTTDQPAVSATKGFSFSPVGGWFGSPERKEISFSASDAPDSLEANKVYIAHAKVKMPPGGLFFLAGEHVAITPYLAYEGPGTFSWVVGGGTPAGFALPHRHFDVRAPVASIILDKSGTLVPNPQPTSDSNPQPQEFPFSVPPDAVFVRAEVVGTATASGTRIDVDLHLKANGQDIGSGSGPDAHEVVEIGPGELTAAGRSFVAHVTGSGAGGSTFKLVITAYGP